MNKRCLGSRARYSAWHPEIIMTSNARSPKRNASRIDGADARNGIYGSLSGEQAERDRCWLAENSDAIDAENVYTEKYGLPLAKYRLF